MVTTTRAKSTTTATTTASRSRRNQSRSSPLRTRAMAITTACRPRRNQNRSSPLRTLAVAMGTPVGTIHATPASLPMVTTTITTRPRRNQSRGPLLQTAAVEMEVSAMTMQASSASTTTTTFPRRSRSQTSAVGMEMKTTACPTPTATRIKSRPRRNRSQSSPLRTTALAMEGASGNDYTNNVDSHCDYGPVKEEPESEFADMDGGGGDGGNDGYRDYGRLKKAPEPELDCGNDNASDDCGSPEEDPESKVIDIYYHPVKDEPEPELGGGDGDVSDADDGREVSYDCCHCGLNLCTQEFKVKHELRCKDRMQRRELESQVTKLYNCRYCKCPFLSKEYKEQHQRKCCRKRPVAPRRNFKGTYFECDKCKYVTKWKYCLKRHVLNHNKNNSEWFTCTGCPYKTVHKNDMTEHSKIHSNTFSCCCPICGKSFIKKRCLDDHLLRQHSDQVSKLITNKVYTCDICDKFRTVKKYSLKEHITLTHLKGVRCQKYQCPHCPYSTFRKYHLKVHSKTHAEQKDYRCTLCKQQFIQKRGLDRHILRIHADNVDSVKTITSKLHRCALCCFKTVGLTGLKKHVRSKHF